MGQTTILGHGRFFTKPKAKAYDQIEWVKRDAFIKTPITGKVIFEQKGVEVPEDWSLNSSSLIAQKYFSGTLGTKNREASLKQLIDRVVDTIIKQGLQEGYFETQDEAEDFREELKYVLATQRAAFNSKVWFNIGLPERAQQASSCFILAVEDTIPSVLDWYEEESMIIRGGSGSGVNLSPIRSATETLSTRAGLPSGPVSFMRGADAAAGAIRKGGKAPGAYNTVILNVSHPDIEEFIWCKAIEQRKARILEENGFDMDSGGMDAFSVQYQNANNSVRVDDDFMQSVLDDKSYELKAVKTGKVLKTIKAKDLFGQINEAAWESANPGIQFNTTINKWHTTPNGGPITASDPRSEYMSLDNSACNLSSINLLKYLREDNTFDIDAYKHTVELMFTAQEILVGYSSYPTEKITKTARAYRQLGLGYANLGALLMAQGLAYDSEEGRAQAAVLTALMTGYAYATSAKIAKRVGPFAGFHKDREAMLNVLKMHRQEVSKIDASMVSEELLSAAASSWDEAVEFGEMYGIRNAQASLLSRSTAIELMMDCDTTGIEPTFSLLIGKSLTSTDPTNVAGQTLPRALKSLGYSKQQTDSIIKYIDSEKTIIGAPDLRDEHKNVFACSVGDNSIHYMGHVKMIAAVQPFLSGAISKTVHVPEETTVADLEQLHIEAWRIGLKAIAIFRDNSRVVGLTPTIKKESSPAAKRGKASLEDKIVIHGAVRRQLPKIRKAKTFSYKVAGSHGYVTVGEYEDGAPGEIFLRIAKQGSTLAGAMDALAISVSHGLQYGVPLKDYVKSFTNMSFTPAGVTDDDEIKTASSVVDYIFRRLAFTYLSFDDLLELGLKSSDDISVQQTSLLS